MPERYRCFTPRAMALVVAVLLVLTPFGAARAAAPDNDLFAGRKTVQLGFSEILDTTDATTDEDDVQLNDGCEPATDASVWYQIELDRDATVLVDVRQSTYSAAVIVGTGSEGDLSQVTCGSNAIAFEAKAGITYFVLAVDDQTNGDGLNGGSLHISFSEVIRPHIETFTVNDSGTADHDGVAHVSGTFACTGTPAFIQITGTAEQHVGRLFTILGFIVQNLDETSCDGTLHTWFADVVPTQGSGKFGGGPADIGVNLEACDTVFRCENAFVDQDVKLRGGH